jgi:hypothetical protein
MYSKKIYESLYKIAYPSHPPHSSHPTLWLKDQYHPSDGVDLHYKCEERQEIPYKELIKD